jgi:hypothetical protein
MNASDELIIAQAATITGTFNCSNRNIQSLDGIQYFTGIRNLHAYDNQLSSLPNISGLTQLEHLQVQRNQIRSLPPLQSLVQLRLLFVYDNQLTQLPEVSHLPNLDELLAYKNLLTSLPSLEGLTNLLKLFVYDNRLTSIPDLSDLTALENLQIQRNNIQTLPSLQSLTQLKNLNANSNQLSTFPNINACTLIESLNLRDNLLSSITPWNNLNFLQSVDLRNNMLTYADIESLVSLPNYSSSNYLLFPQNSFQVMDTSIYIGSSIAKTVTLDETLAHVSYKWFKGNINTAAVSTTATLSILNSTLTNSSTYRAFVFSTLFPGDSILALEYQLIVEPCPLPTQFTTTIIRPVSCFSSGEISISGNSVLIAPQNYLLQSILTGRTTTSTNGVFTGLTETQYTAQVVFTSQCIVSLSATPIVFIKENCNETFISPNGDSDMDDIAFETTDEIKIYNKNGEWITTLKGPAVWNGTNDKGQMVPMGIYIVRFTQSKTIHYVTVVY